MQKFFEIQQACICRSDDLENTVFAELLKTCFCSWNVCASLGYGGNDISPIRPM